MRQGSIRSPLPFLSIIIDFVMTKGLDDASFVTEWGQIRLAELDFEDAISALRHTLAGIQEIAMF